MVTSELTKIDSAVVARSDEIQSLSRFLSPYLQPRPFCKKPRQPSEGCIELVPAEKPKRRTPVHSAAEVSKPGPFHRLRDELALLLGAAGTNLVLKTWERHELDLQEADPSRLRPALLKLFASAARITAPHGNSRALKVILRAFESDYFPISLASPTTASSVQNHRSTLLALIQTGNGATLLTTVLKPLTPRPAAHSAGEGDRLRLRREFLFEASCRAKSWTEAYRQARLLSYGTPRPDLGARMEHRLAEVYGNNLDSAVPASKKKQIYSDIARLRGERGEQPREFALRAASAVAVPCRPGEDEALLCKLLSPSDVRWFVSLRRLYRHRPVAETWTGSLRKLWQREPTLRPYCRLLFSLLRFSRRRAEVARAGLPPIAGSERLEICQSRARLQRARDEVKRWSGLLEPAEEASAPLGGGCIVKLRHSLWEHVSKVCCALGLPLPQAVRVVPRFEDVAFRQVNGHTELVVNPVLLSSREGEARFLLARALFRQAAGLQSLHAGGQRLASVEGIAERAQAYTEWMSYPQSALDLLRGQETPTIAEVDELQVSLEELYWQTGNPVYPLFCEVLANRCWCPRGELEADVFAHGYCDLIDATYGVLATGLSNLTLYRNCESSGIGSLLPRMEDHPNLVLRLQNLWMSAAEEVQKGALTSRPATR